MLELLRPEGFYDDPPDDRRVDIQHFNMWRGSTAFSGSWGGKLQEDGVL